MWSLTDFDAQAGESDLHGHLVFNFSGPRPAIAANLFSNTLDADMVLALIDAAPKDETEAVRTQKAPVEKLRAADAHVVFVAREITGAPLPIEEIAIELQIEDGNLVADPVEVGLEEGSVSGAIRLDASGDTQSGRIDLVFDSVALAPIAAPFKIDYPVSGFVDGMLALAFAGEDIEIADGQIVYRAPERDTNLAIALDRVKTDDGDLQITAEGQFRGEPARLAFEGAPLALLFAAGHRLPIDIEIEIAATQAKARGTFAALGKTLDLDVSVSGPGTARFSKLTGVELPPLPAYAFSGHVVREEDVIKVTDLKAKVGGSDAAGDVLLNTQGEKPYINAELKSTTLRYADFDQLQKKDEKKEPFSLARLDAFNGDIEIEAQRAIAPGQVAFSDVLIAAIVKDGRLSATPVKFGVGGGRVAANLELAQENDRLLGQIDAEIESVDLSVALKPIGLGERFEGVLDADFDFAFGPRGKSKAKARFAIVSPPKIPMRNSSSIRPPIHWWCAAMGRLTAKRSSFRQIWANSRTSSATRCYRSISI